MKIEVLFPEFCNLYGDLANIKYLRQCLPEAEFIETTFEDTPRFTKEKMDLVYLGPMTEKMQERTIEKLWDEKEKIQQEIQQDTTFLFTGNSMEVLEKYIENEDHTKIEGLGILDFYAQRDRMNRFNDRILGTLRQENIEMIGFKNQFTQTIGNNENNYFIENQKGSGLSKDSKYEGVQIHHFIGTYLLGPILILNPLFTKYLLTLMGEENPKLAFEEEIMQAYQYRLEEFKRLG